VLVGVMGPRSCGMRIQVPAMSFCVKIENLAVDHSERILGNRVLGGGRDTVIAALLEYGRNVGCRIVESSSTLPILSVAIQDIVVCWRAEEGIVPLRSDVHDTGW